ncbi:MAG: hypothetical protein F4Z94_09065, partial [Chloroflexi bacterium]|nr:hypothetical protein [Chloroflexota bacterium]
DKTSEIQPAQPGIRETITLARYENGSEVSRETAESQLVQPPQNQIIGYGTKPVVLGAVNTPAGPREYWRVLCMYATSYSPRSSGGNTITAIGETLRRGIVASDPDLIPYRSDVFVPGYGVGYMADTAGYRSAPYWIDLGFSDADYSRDWHEYVKVYLLTPLPARFNALLPASRPNSRGPGGGNYGEAAARCAISRRVNFPGFSKCALCPASPMISSHASGIASCIAALMRRNLSSSPPTTSRVGACRLGNSAHKLGCAPLPMPRKLFAKPTGWQRNRCPRCAKCAWAGN